MIPNLMFTKGFTCNSAINSRNFVENPPNHKNTKTRHNRPLLFLFSFIQISPKCKFQFIKMFWFVTWTLLPSPLQIKNYKFLKEIIPFHTENSINLFEIKWDFYGIRDFSTSWQSKIFYIFIFSSGGKFISWNVC